MPKNDNYDWYIGIDEVGRGPLAGPVTICVAAFKEKRPRSLAGIKDSKKLSEKQRGVWRQKIEKEKEKGNALFFVCSSDNRTIDDDGLTKAIRDTIKIGLTKLNVNPNTCLVLLDGGLKAPIEYINQETIIKGDEKERIIAAASIVAKIDRDKVMVEFNTKYPEYGFHEHKGYGTHAHYEALKKHGACDIHRKIFLKKFYDTIN